MLTTAQYKALKDWPDGLNIYIKNDRVSANLGKSKITLIRLLDLLMSGFVYAFEDDSFEMAIFSTIQPACDDAIREYEKANNIDGGE